MCLGVCVLGCMCLGMCICMFRCVCWGVLLNGPWPVFVWVVVAACGYMAKAPKYRNSDLSQHAFPNKIRSKGKNIKALCFPIKMSC